MPVIYPDSEALGILVCERQGRPPFAESGFLRRLILAGIAAGLRVFAFDPRMWRPNGKTVPGWTPEPEGTGWRLSEHPLPALLYDRAWPADDDERVRFRQAMSELESALKPIRLNGKLPGKWRVFSVLSGHAQTSRLLPPTEIYDGPGSFHDFLKRCGGSLFLKPAGGGQGRRTAACTTETDGRVRVRGRSGANRPFDLTFRDGREASGKLERWIGNRLYLMQPYLSLTGSDGKPFDIRVLAQKNGRGRWAVTGIAARCGPAGTVTANLHGGGRACPADERLSDLFGTARSAEILREIRGVCAPIVRILEQHFGRFCELGLDFGLDQSGRLWFLEANSKPGRRAMSAIGASAANAAAARPIAYAKSILLRPPGRVIHEFDHL
ncbi:YheC/YheD family protein [Cohnella caldifontis]|uniref:YheC/YheD family endospore coat-associated protein n=1 Tax=Cohnella caldifontis TaxID=3027471 RepID=UPI0023ED1F5C|nr:YheC/YheD family protein [Cohnella sp. YIM B05605]